MEITPSNQTASVDESNFQTDLNSIGSLIKKAREHKNLTLESLAENLKINKSYLSAIENGDYKSLPEMIYVKAMIRRVAEKLEVDLNLQAVFGKDTKSIKDELLKREDVKAEPFKKSFLIIPILALATFFFGIFTVKVGLQWLLIDSNTNEISIPNSKK